MINGIQSEFLKQKKRLALKLLWMAPVITIGLVLVLMGGRFFMEGAYNWWYTTILPGTLAMIVAFTVSAEKKHNQHGLFSVCQKKEILWTSQIIMHSLLLLFLNLIFFVLVSASGWFLGLALPHKALLLASLTLTLTYMWQIPVIMWVSDKIGSIATIALFLIFNIGFGLIFSPSKLWVVPFAIPSRLMCPIIRVFPNGLPMDASSQLGDPSVIPIGIAITALLFVVFSIMTALGFRNREVK